MFATFSIIFAITLALIPAGVHLGFRAPRTRETGSPADYGLAFEELSIPTVRGRQLFGWLLPAPAATCTIVVLHGWGSNAELMLPLAVPLRRAGFNLLLCDSRSHGRSDADSFSSLPRFAEDLGMAILWLKAQHPHLADRIAVLGHSVGAGAALFEASRNADIAAVISIAAFADPAQVTAGYLRPLHFPRLLIRLVCRYVEWVIGYRFAAIAPMNTVRSIACPILLVHGTADRTVAVDDAHLILTNCPAPHARLLEIDGAGHDSVDRIEQHVGELLGFLEQHCPAR
ncbi:alpha/beta fold hydrolase [uncultured Thiodictyon sp.]|uniref:alpha/beta hydrolase n=1 Tax=uncultured Thiodictyon sp. TaxID=1846217 RepID=UPI0025EE6280|nr:alpha/beta fold hydrolase [uncultured Thiodictyon sp.]